MTLGPILFETIFSARSKNSSGFLEELDLLKMRRPTLSWGGIHAVLLDLDGVVLDSKDAQVASVRAGFEAASLPYPREDLALEVARRFDLGTPDTSLLEVVGIHDLCLAQVFREEYLRSWQALSVTKVAPFPRVEETLEHLSSRYELALITLRHQSKATLEALLRGLDLRGFFKVVITSYDVVRPKPSPEPVIKAADLLRVTPIESCVVGDSPLDIRSGKAAGARTVAVLSGLFGRHALECEKPDLVVESLRNLLP